jgi:predicted permease
MLVKHPALTLIGGLGMAVAIALGAISYDVRAALFSRLPLDEGDRVIAIENWDTQWNDQERRVLHDFVEWRDRLESVRDLGAWREIRRNLIVSGGGTPEPVTIAEMTAAGFALARVPPLVGRTLVEGDQRPGAADVAVIGYDLWRTRFASDHGVVGREIGLGAATHTIVGVMPEGFAFPVNHRVWVPLRVDPTAWERRRGPAIFVFGRLAPGATMESAQAELTAFGERMAAELPATHERLRPRIVSYRLQFFDDMMGWEFHFLQLVFVLLLVVVGVNVAVLVYARTATRRGEIAVRSALGASRRRIVGQLFVEALVLSGGAAAIGIAIVGLVYRQVNAVLAMFSGFDGLPFWIDFGLSTGTVLYAAVLAVLCAVLVGIVPALQATGRAVHANLQRLGAGGSGMRFGKTWTALIVAQVAFTVALLPAGIAFAGSFIRHGLADPGFATDEFLTARLALDHETPRTAEAEVYERQQASRYATLQAELDRRLEAEPGVSDVLFIEGVPGFAPTASVEIDTQSPPAQGDGVTRRVAGVRRMHIDYFDVFGVPVLSGRNFHAGDVLAGAATSLRDGDGDGIPELRHEGGVASTAVIVNRTFVQEILGSGSAVGRRVRYLDQRGGEPGPWHEIIGVVEDFPANRLEPDMTMARIYHPVAPTHVFERLVVRMHSGVSTAGAGTRAFAARLRRIATELDPALRLTSIATLSDELRSEQIAMRLGALGIGAVALSVLLLATAGIYAIMSFTVAQRRREIGVRAALGADRRHILASIFSRAAMQLCAGVVTGLAVATLLDRATDGELTLGNGLVLVPAVSAFMVAVGLLAALGPARRGLAIQPTEALREDL